MLLAEISILYKYFKTLLNISETNAELLVVLWGNLKLIFK